MGITLPNEIKSKRYVNIKNNEDFELDNAISILGILAKQLDDDTLIEDKFQSETNWQDEDSKGMITKFIVDTANTSGHFTDGTNRITIKNVGTNNPYVKENMFVFLDGYIIFIQNITNNGEQDDEVEFYIDGGVLAEGEYDVIKINGIFNYEFEQDEGVLFLSKNIQSEENTYDAGDSALSNLGNDSFRIAIPSGTYLSNAQKLKFRIKAGDPIKINAVSIVKRHMTLDDWFENASGTARLPSRYIFNDTIPLYGFELHGDGDLSNNSNYSIPLTGLTPADVYHLSFIGQTDTASGKSVKIAFSNEDGKWYNFTGVNAGTYTTETLPTTDQIFSQSLDTTITTYTPTECQVPIDTTGEIGIFFIAYDDSIRIGDIDFRKDGTGSNIVLNPDCANWTGTENGETTPTQIFTRDGDADWNFEVGAGEEIESKTIVYDFKINQDYLLIVDTSDTPTGAYRYTTELGIDTYYKANVQTYDKKDMGIPDSTISDTLPFFSKIILMPEGIVTNEYYTSVCGTSFTTMATTSITGDDIETDITTSANTYVTFSFDGKNTFAYFDSSTLSFIDIASNKNSIHGGTEGNWYYKTYSTGLWTATPSDFNNMQFAISSALRNSAEYRKSYTSFEEILFTADNGFEQGKNFHIAYTMISTENNQECSIYKTDYVIYDSSIFIPVPIVNTLFEVYTLERTSEYQRTKFYLRNKTGSTINDLYVHYF